MIGIVDTTTPRIGRWNPSDHPNTLAPIRPGGDVGPVTLPNIHDSGLEPYLKLGSSSSRQVVTGGSTRIPEGQHQFDPSSSPHPAVGGSTGLPPRPSLKRPEEQPSYPYYAPSPRHPEPGGPIGLPPRPSLKRPAEQPGYPYYAPSSRHPEPGGSTGLPLRPSLKGTEEQHYPHVPYASSSRPSYGGSTLPPQEFLSQGSQRRPTMWPTSDTTGMLGYTKNLYDHRGPSNSGPG